MGVPYAEVIGDPVSHSKSPLIHKFWLDKLGAHGEYRTVRITKRELPFYLKAKRKDVHWRGCNVTAPLKEPAAILVPAPLGLCEFLGAVNCITRTPLGCLVGTNTDIAGIGEALTGVEWEGAEIFLIGAGGAARGVLCYLMSRGVGKISIIAREEAKARALSRLAHPESGISIPTLSFDALPASRSKRRVIINATPMGMRGGEPMNAQLLEWLEKEPRGEMMAFDMVYEPLETVFLVTARNCGAVCIDGLAMLIGQAAPAFELFFGLRAPRQHDAELRHLLTP